MQWYSLQSLGGETLLVLRCLAAKQLRQAPHPDISPLNALLRYTCVSEVHGMGKPIHSGLWVHGGGSLVFCLTF